MSLKGIIKIKENLFPIFGKRRLIPKTLKKEIDVLTVDMFPEMRSTFVIDLPASGFT